MPAGAAVAPGRLPPGVLALLARLPQREVLRRLLQLGGVVALALLHLLERAVRELAVAVERRHAEVHVAAALVGVAESTRSPISADDRVDRLGGLRLRVRAAEPEPVGVLDVPGGHLARELRARHAALARGVVDLVVHVGDVHDQRRVVALVLEEALEQREDHERPRVPDVDPAVDRRAAGVDADPVAVARLDRDDVAAQRVVNAQLAHAREATQATGGLRSVQRSSPSSCAARPMRVASSLCASHDHHADRQAVVAHAARHRDRRLAGEVPFAGERRLDLQPCRATCARRRGPPTGRPSTAAPRSPA